MATVLGIRVTDRMLERWRGWVMPAVQPFVLSDDDAHAVRRLARKRTLSPELRDTFEVDDPVVWLDRAGAKTLSDDALAAQPTTHRWPTASPGYDEKRTIGFVTRGAVVSRHGEVSDAVWRRAAEVLPDARRIAGRFRDRSGPNSFSTVMGAAGVAGAENEEVGADVFDAWLAETTIPGGNDELPGTVYVWRDDERVARHASVSLGDGWYLHKASRGWMSPTVVLDVRDGINASRLAGQHIERHTIIPPRLR